MSILSAVEWNGPKIDNNQNNNHCRDNKGISN